MVTFPLDLVLGEIRIPSHLIFDLLAYYLGFSYYLKLRERKGDFMSPTRRIYLLIGAAIGALLISRLLAALENPALFLNPSSILYYFQGQTIVGGLLGGIIGVEITKKLIKERKPTGDLFTFPIILAMIIGRIGCLLTGVSDRTVGIHSTLPWAFDQGDGIPRHPTSLYEIIFLIGIWIGLYRADKKDTLKNGALFKIFIFSYLVFRFLIEFIKPAIPLAAGLSAIQLASLIGALYYGKILFIDGIHSNGTRSTKYV
ncbi:prolipoprotein diacylglyceryl transferase [Candidatus Pacearchaeota archaeon]|nr:prolipoprotein diacylglyceryl transferase [Candidatus Pacearchaeota archaeon]